MTSMTNTSHSPLLPPMPPPSPPLVNPDKALSCGAGLTYAWPIPGSFWHRVERKFTDRGIIWLLRLLYLLVCACLFVYGYTWEDRQGYQDIRQYTLPVGRGCGYILALSCGLLLLPMSRTLSTVGRSFPVFSQLVPLDAATSVHKHLALLVVAASIVHGAGQGLNYIYSDYYSLTTPWTPQASGVLGLCQVLCTGIAISLCLLLICITSLPVVRRGAGLKFRAFFALHRLYWPFQAMLLWHGCKRGQIVYAYFAAAPICIFLLDLVLERWSAFTGVVTEAVLLEDGVIRLSVSPGFKGGFKAGQFARLAILSSAHCNFLSEAFTESHPFTISSAPSEGPQLTFHIKAVGLWTKWLREEILLGYVSVGSRVKVWGPYGTPSEHVSQFDRVILISGGIGATPFAAVLKQIVASRRLDNEDGVFDTASVPMAGTYPRHPLSPLLKTDPLPSASSEGFEEEPDPDDSMRSDWIHAGMCACASIPICWAVSRMYNCKIEDLSRWNTFLIKLRAVYRSVIVCVVMLATFLVGVTMHIICFIIRPELFNNLGNPVQLPTQEDVFNVLGPLNTPYFLGFVCYHLMIYTLVATLFIDLSLLGSRRFFSYKCLRRDFIVVVILTIISSLLFAAIIICRNQRRVHLSMLFAIITGFVVIIPVFHRFIHIAGGVLQPCQYHAPAFHRPHKIDFIWVNRSMQGLLWLLKDLVLAQRALPDVIKVWPFITLKPIDRKSVTDSLKDFRRLLSYDSLNDIVSYSSTDDDMNDGFEEDWAAKVDASVFLEDSESRPRVDSASSLGHALRVSLMQENPMFDPDHLYIPKIRNTVASVRQSIDVDEVDSFLKDAGVDINWGRPDWVALLTKIAHEDYSTQASFPSTAGSMSPKSTTLSRSHRAKVIGIFFCGSQSMFAALSTVAVVVSQKTHTRFVLKKEIF